MFLVLYNKNKPFTGSVLDIDTVTVSENKTLFFYLLLQMQKKIFCVEKKAYDTRVGHNHAGTGYFGRESYIYNANTTANSSHQIADYITHNAMRQQDDFVARLLLLSLLLFINYNTYTINFH